MKKKSLILNGFLGFLLLLSGLWILGNETIIKELKTKIQEYTALMQEAETYVKNCNSNCKKDIDILTKYFKKHCTCQSPPDLELEKERVNRDRKKLGF